MMLDRIRGRREREKQVREENRLPPGQSLTVKFPVLHYGATPSYKSDLSNWDFRIFGLVEDEKRWNWDAFNQLPKTKVVMDIHCVTRWSKFDTVWEGVSLKTLIDEGIVTPKPGANYILQYCDYDFTTNLPLSVMLQDNVLLATAFNGQPLEREHGYPLRVVIGSFTDRSEEQTAYFWKGGKWLRALEFRAEDQPGFWERAGYHNEGDPWKEQRYGRFR
jgi:DMSO/TMAO reductase YedYZ molybdopterin-dependent catalytic subunit